MKTENWEVNIGLFDIIRKKRAVNETSIKKGSILDLIDSKSLIKKNAFDYLPVHPDILDLLWIADGPMKNYSQKPISVSKFEVNGLIYTLTFSGASEPSVIFTNLPIQKVNDKLVERPSYYPNYRDLTNEQKGVYWSLLADPYNSSIDVGYVFILYYGLERHLLNGEFEKAFNVILKLRDAHSNKSFQSYSGNALVLSCLFHQRPDMAMKFLLSLDKEHELNFSNNLFLMVYFGFKIPIKPKDIIRMSKTFGFENNNYIKKYPKLFNDTMIEILIEKYGKEEIMISDFVSSSDLKKLKTEKLNIFSNISLSDNEINVPIYTDNLKFKKSMYDILELTHEKVKNELPNLRKTNAVTEIIVVKEPLKLLVFDMKVEEELLIQLRSSKSNLISKHFSLINLQDFYYRYRSIDVKYLEKCIEYCNQDIEMLQDLQNYYKQEEIKNIKKTSYLYSATEIKKDIQRVETEGFIGRIPAFERLAIIYEKQGKIEEALEICDKAITYNINVKGNSQDYIDRKEALIKKVHKV